MVIPTNIVSALLLVVFVLPGFVFVSVRGMLRAPGSVRDVELSSRLVTSVVISIVFDAGYLVIAGSIVPLRGLRDLPTDGATFLAESPVALGILVLVLGVIAPAALSAVLAVEWVPIGHGLPNWMRRPRRRHGFRDFPSAWDRAVPGLGGTYVRIRLASGQWVGGFFSSESFVSTYPHPRDIYIQRQYSMLPDGTFGDPVPRSSGVWIAIGDNDVVEWLSPER